MIAIFALARAADSAPSELDTLARLAALEWRRGAPVEIAGQIAGGSTEVRVAGVRALGRLRSAEALDSLRAWRDDPDPAVRAEVARAFGWTPGGTQDLRDWWAAGESEPEVAAAVLVGLGRQGDVRDVREVSAAVSAPVPVGPAAARALGLLASRGVEGTAEVAAPVLLDRLAGLVSNPLLDPRMVEACAWALQRGRIPVPADRVADVLAVIDSGPSLEARAWLLRAVWPSLDRPQRDEWFLRAMTDSPRLVQQTVLAALGPDDASPDVLAAFLSDSDTWVRHAVIDALGRLDDADAVLEQIVAESTDPDERARAIRALHHSDPVRAADEGLSVLERAAWVETLDDQAALVRWLSAEPTDRTDARGAEILRGAAAGALSAREDLGAEARRAMLASPDPLVRRAGYDGAPVGLVLGPLASESDPEAAAAGWKVVAAAVASDPSGKGALKKGDAAVEAALGALKVADAPTEALARRVADALGLAAPPVTRPASPIPWPADLADVMRIRSARVTTDQGEFVVALTPEVAPLAVSVFAHLAEDGFYDGLVFHRVVPGFVAQTGCPRGDGWGGPGFLLPDEDSEIPFSAGSLGMAREEARDTGGSQWFVTLSDQPHLTSEYTRFGEVVHGLHVAQRLRQGATLVHVEIERLP